MKFFMIIVLLSFWEKEAIEQKISRNNLEIKNYIFLSDFFEQDAKKTQKYWHGIANGLEKMVFIDIKNQQLSVLEFADTFQVILQTKISSGKFKGSTPTGEFKILKKRLFRPSYRHGGVMTHWNCLTRDEAIGIHGLRDISYEKNLGRPASHGCIRISKSVEKIFYSLAPIGTKVLIE